MGSFKIKCHICKTVNKEKAQPVKCSACKTDLKEPGAEILQKKVACAFLLGGKIGSYGESGWNGDLYLTGRRLFFIKSAPIQTGSFSGSLVEEYDPDLFDLMPCNIKSFGIEESGKKGINDKFIITTDKDETIRFSIPKIK